MGPGMYHCQPFQCQEPGGPLTLSYCHDDRADHLLTLASASLNLGFPNWFLPHNSSISKSDSMDVALRAFFPENHTCP